MVFEFKCKCPHCGNEEFDYMWGLNNDIELMNDDGEVADVVCPKCNELFEIEIEQESIFRVFNVREDD